MAPTRSPGRGSIGCAACCPESSAEARRWGVAKAPPIDWKNSDRDPGEASANKSSKKRRRSRSVAHRFAATGCSSSRRQAWVRKPAWLSIAGIGFMHVSSAAIPVRYIFGKRVGHRASTRATVSGRDSTAGGNQGFTLQSSTIGAES
jgi:hypothetical protein